MKQSGECPKCNGSRIWNNSHITEATIPKRWIPVSGSTWKPWKRKIAFKDEYVCLDCGYTETYIRKTGLGLIRKLSDSQL